MTRFATLALLFVLLASPVLAQPPADEWKLHVDGQRQGWYLRTDQEGVMYYQPRDWSSQRFSSVAALKAVLEKPVGGVSQNFGISNPGTLKREQLSGNAVSASPEDCIGPNCPTVPSADPAPYLYLAVPIAAILLLGALVHRLKS